ncbi:hypothetical protein EWE75_24110 [Sphingomonas populi]|uniref:Uncharacterized protein n=1 Tax=Sphingomonas populi TaxID=2484750 RepID=A0A4Q6XHG6_9SPHN|nr:hypothetical protein EWE75_24110 [Sphingomonas populi]
MLSLLPWGVMLTLIAGLAVYFYKNNITYDIVTIDTRIDDENPVIKVTDRYGYVVFERIELKNNGFKSFDNVELYLKISSEPFKIKFTNASSVPVHARAFFDQKASYPQ